MPFYQRQGNIPPKRHTVFRREGGELYYEELIGNKGFSGPSSLFYHLRPPTRILKTTHLKKLAIEADNDMRLRQRHFRLGQINAHKSPTLDRQVALFNQDVLISLLRPTKNDDFFFRNSQYDELYFVAEGKGVFESICGSFAYSAGDYIVIPRGITYRLKMDESVSQRFLLIETPSYLRTPKRYRNEHGQMLEHSPFCERDIRMPTLEAPLDEVGEFNVVMRQRDQLTEVVFDHHPCDLVGWDGYYFPWAFNINDFEPLTGRIHLPPPVHQTFEADAFVICSFVPRLYDYHPEAIPAPYNHTNVMTDEVLFYAKDKFMSRKGIEFASLTLHPDGLAHGPHPGKAEASIGAKETDELAVMIDTFRPLNVASGILSVEDLEYERSWID